MSVVCHSFVTFMHCGQTAADGLMISSQPDRASTWVRHTPTALKSVKLFSSSGGPSGPTISSMLQTSIPASKRCEIGTWLL
jgi:hypothetical protein